MKIAVSNRDENVCEQFSNTAQFILYETSGNVILEKEIVLLSIFSIQAVWELFVKKGVEILLCGAISGGEKEYLRHRGVAVFSGVEGRAQKAAEMFLCNDLRFDTGLSCPHHGGNCGEK